MKTTKCRSDIHSNLTFEVWKSIFCPLQEDSRGHFFIATFVQRKLRAVSHQTYTFYHFFKWRYCQEFRKKGLFCCWHLFCSRWCRRWWWFWPSHSWTQFSQLFLFLCCWFLTQLQSWPKITINWSVTLLDSFCWSQPGLRTQKRAVQNSRQRTNGCLNISIWKLFFGIMSSFRTSKPAILKSLSNNFTEECLSQYSILAVNFRVNWTFWKFKRCFY